MRLHVILLQPEIPPNTGNIIRLAANSGACLHLVEPLGFSLDDKQLRRAGLDYRDYAEVRVHPDLAAARAAAEGNGGGRCFAVTGSGSTRYDMVRYRPGDILLFGRESTGLAAEVRQQFGAAQQLYIPMRPDSRSLNLSNAVAVVVMEAWRQLGYPGAARK